MSRSDGHADAAGPAPIFAALGDETRLSLLAELSAGGSRSIAALSADRRLTRQAVTKHLHVLEQAGLVESLRVGRESRYALRPGGIGQARSYLDRVAAGWDEALGRLKLLVEEAAGEG